MNTSKGENGRTVQDLWETSAKLTWAAAPKYQKTNSCIEFVLKMKTADSYIIVYTGKETSATCDTITKGVWQPGATVAWKIRYVNAAKHGCCGGVGVASADINKNKDQNCFNCGWYYNPYASVLRSGPPMMLRDKKYGHKDRSFGSTLNTGDEIGVVMDM